MKINKKEYLILLKELIMFDTSNSNEEIMHDFISEKLENAGFDVSIDEFKNIYATRGDAKKYPLLNAHMDIVRTIKIDKKEVSCDNCIYVDVCAESTTFIKTGDWMNGYDYSYLLAKKCKFFINANETTINEPEIEKEFTLKYSNFTNILQSNETRVMGGDDKCGIAVILWIAMNTTIPLKILLTSREEIGCVGMKAFEATNKKWLKNLKYSLTLDRKNFGQILLTSAGKRNCTNKFASSLVVHALNNNIRPTIKDGSIADVIVLRKYCEAVNLSVCYYNPHSVTEYIQFDELIKTTGWVNDIIKNI